MKTTTPIRVLSALRLLRTLRHAVVTTGLLTYPHSHLHGRGHLLLPHSPFVTRRLLSVSAGRGQDDDNHDRSLQPLSPGEKLRLLREQMALQRLDTYVCPSEDPHMSEYPPARFCRREYISGFTGSAGVAVIRPDTALLFTDGRYFEQAER
jgi:hypothetical protein